MVIPHLISITIAWIIDWFVGDPPNWPHPVRWMGNLIKRLNLRLNRGKHKKFTGILFLFIVIIIAFGLSFLLVWGAYQIHLIFGILIESIIIATTIAQKDLGTAALRVYNPLSEGELQRSRFEVSMIVGRDTDNLDEEGITRATVETVAESIGDGITAPLFWALIGGAPLAIVYRAVNTCDSMVGYKNARYRDFGWASARFDDVLNWIPSRITGFLMMVTKRTPHMKRQEAMKHWHQDAKKHASPNSGYLEAAVALFLGVQLGGINYYKGIESKRALLGMKHRELEKNDILHAIRIMRRAVAVFMIFLWIGGAIFVVTSTWI